MRMSRTIGAAAAALSLSACATITRGTKETYRVVSEPTGADVRLSTGQTCTTPCAMRLKRKTAFTATISKPGYDSMEATVASRTKAGGIGAAAGNVLIGGVVGGVVDGSNGSIRDLTPNPLSVKLRPASEENSDAPAQNGSPSAADAPD